MSCQSFLNNPVQLLWLYTHLQAALEFTFSQQHSSLETKKLNLDILIQCVVILKGIGALVKKKSLNAGNTHDMARIIKGSCPALYNLHCDSEQIQRLQKHVSFLKCTCFVLLWIY